MLSERMNWIPERFSEYLELTKPGIVLSILLTTVGGFVLGAMDSGQVFTGLWLLVGTAFSAASAGTLNHYLETDHDARMERTRNRPIPAGRILPLAALSFGVFLGLAGLAVLLIAVNALTALLAGLTIALYIWVYTPLKRRSTLNTLVGAIPGALPPLAGWTAATNRLDLDALLIFAIFFFWQMPHFYALAWMYRDDYAAGGFRMLPVLDSSGSKTARATLGYSLVLLVACVGLGVSRSFSILYFVFSVLLGVFLIWFAYRLGRRLDRPSAVQVFLASLAFLPGFVVLLLLERFLIPLLG